MEIAPAIHGNGAGVQRHSGIGCGRKAIVAGEEAEQSPMFGDIGFASDRNMRDRLDRSAHLWAGTMDAVERRDKAAGREQVDEIGFCLHLFRWDRHLGPDWNNLAHCYSFIESLSINSEERRVGKGVSVHVDLG